MVCVCVFIQRFHKSKNHYPKLPTATSIVISTFRGLAKYIVIATSSISGFLICISGWPLKLLFSIVLIEYAHHSYNYKVMQQTKLR